MSNAQQPVDFSKMRLDTNKPRPQKKTPLSDKLFTVGMLVVISLVAIGAYITEKNKKATASPDNPPETKPEAVDVWEQHRTGYSVYMKENKQQVFDIFHHVGTANDVVLHEVYPEIGPGRQKLINYRFTVYWSGPVQVDGFTTAHIVYDCEAKRPIRTEVLATNGITKREANQALIEFGAALLKENMRQSRGN